MAVRQLSDGNPSGNTFGRSASDLISLYGVTPAAQRGNASQAAVSSTAVTSTTPFGFATSTQGNALLALVLEMRTVLVTIGAMKGSA